MLEYTVMNGQKSAVISSDASVRMGACLQTRCLAWRQKSEEDPIEVVAVGAAAAVVGAVAADVGSAEDCTWILEAAFAALTGSVQAHS